VYAQARPGAEAGAGNGAQNGAAKTPEPRP
jgi:hypothetical protein